MDALKFEVQFETGLEGHPFCIGHKTSTLTKKEFGLLIEFIYYYGATHGVQFLEPKERNA